MTDLEERVVLETGVSRRAPPPLALPGVLRVAKARRTTLAAALTDAFGQRRLIVLLPFALIAGLIASLLTPVEPEPWALATVGSALLVALPLTWRSLRLFRLTAIVAAVWLGFSLLAIHGALFGTAMLRYPAYGTYSMRIDEVLSEPESGIRAIVSAITPEAGSKALPVRRARIVVKGLDVAPGDVIQGRVRFYPVPGPVIPDGFDTQFHSYFAGVGAYGNTIGGPTRVTAGDPVAIDRFVDSVRRGIAARIDAELPQPSAGIARALITGDESEVSDETFNTMATAGIAHVLSVSGLHLTIVAGGTFAVLRLLLALAGGLPGRFPVKRFAAIGGMLAALLYFAVSGGNVAALRSTIMILLVLGAVAVGRQALTMRNVAIAALVIVVTDPAGVFRPSFQLSFAAVVGLIGAWELLSRRDHSDRPPRPRMVRYVLGSISTSLIAGAATLPFTVYHFQQTSPLGVLGNLAVLPLVGFVIMPSALVGTLLMPLGFEQPFLWILGWAIDRMVDSAVIVAGWSASLSASPLLTPLSLVLSLGAFAWFAFLRSWHRLIAPALLGPAIVLFALDQPPDLLVSDTTQAMAMRGASGLELIAGKANSFAVGVWQESFGEPIAAKSELLKCDSIGCFGDSPAGFSLALVKQPDAFYEDCSMADVVVARIPAPASCQSPVVIEAGDLATRGVYWLHWQAESRSFEIRSAIPADGRPWRVR